MRPIVIGLFSVCTLILILGVLPGIAQERQIERKIAIVTDGRPWLGVSVQDLTDELIESENLKVKEGAFISEVIKESPADSAGLRGGDVIIEFNNRKIYDADGLVAAVRKTKSGENVTIVADRNGRKLDMKTTLRERPRRTALRVPTPPVPPEPMVQMREMHRSGRVGLRLTNLTPQLGEFFNVPEGKGVLVEEVAKESTAEKAGFKAGDVLMSIDNKDVTTVREVREALGKYDKGDKASVTVVRNRAKTTLTLEFEAKPYSWFEGDRGDFGGNFEMFVFPEEERIRLREELKNLKPDLDEMHIELDRLHEHFKNFRYEFPDNLIREIRIHREIISI
jgi:predicted metalloprotease with PDZ domain